MYYAELMPKIENYIEYFWNFCSPTMRRIIGILPDKLQDIEEAIQYLYTIGDYIMTILPIVLTVYPCITAALVFLCYWEYQNKQIAWDFLRYKGEAKLNCETAPPIDFAKK